MFSDYKPMFRELNQALDFFLGIPLCIRMTEVIFKIKCNGSPLSFLFVSMHKYLKYLISGVCMQVYFTVAFCEKKTHWSLLFHVEFSAKCTFKWKSRRDNVFNKLATFGVRKFN